MKKINHRLEFKFLTLSVFFWHQGCQPTGSSSRSQLSDSPQALGEGQAGGTYYGCGLPLIEAAAKDGLNVSPKDPQRAFDVISAANLNELAESVGILSDSEQKLFETAELMMPPGNTHRTTFFRDEKILGTLSGDQPAQSIHLEVLKPILESGFLNSPKRSQFAVAETGENQPTIKAKVTPPQEEALYGAFGCVFTAVGPRDGRPQYGEVILRFKPASQPPKNAVTFATYSSAFSFMKNARIKVCETQCKCTVYTKELQSNSCQAARSKVGSQKAEAFNFADLPLDPEKYPCYESCNQKVLASMPNFNPGFEERLAYSRTVIAPKHYDEWFRLTLINMLRKNSKKDELATALQATVGHGSLESQKSRWWNLIDTEWLGYLEAKYDGGVALKDLESIEIPEDKLSEVLSWNLSQEIKVKIKKVSPP